MNEKLHGLLQGLLHLLAYELGHEVVQVSLVVHCNLVDIYFIAKEDIKPSSNMNYTHTQETGQKLRNVHCKRIHSLWSYA